LAHRDHQPIRVGVAAAVILACMVASGPSFAGGRSPDQYGATRGFTVSPRPTVASVSRQAQAEIRACPDSAAFQCVADVLTRYAAALQAVSH